MKHGKKWHMIEERVRKYHENPRYLASCYNKLRMSKQEAWDRANGISTMIAYKCQFCKFYHVGRKAVILK